MRRISRFINIVNLLLLAILIASFISVVNINVITYTINNRNEHLLTYLNSNYIEKKISLEEDIDQTILEGKSENNETKKEKNISNNKVTTEIKRQEDNNKKFESVKKEEVVEKETSEDEKNEVSKTEKVLEKLTGSLAGYGPDCAGCTTFKTASGRYIGDGQIYYEDKDYGKIRIVAGDKSYPFGTIVKISNTNYGDNAPIYAIVLDRGGGVGIGKQFLFDLLFATEKEAAKAGSRKDVIFEILRLGY